MDADKKRIWIRGQFVEVTDEVYRAYMQGDRKMRYFENDLKTERFVFGKEGQVVQIIPSREDSLDRLVDENAQQFSDEQESVESWTGWWMKMPSNSPMSRKAWRAWCFTSWKWTGYIPRFPCWLQRNVR